LFEELLISFTISLMQWEFINKLTSLVEAKLGNEKFGPEDLASDAGMSHTHLNRKLKTLCNQNASQFIREIRLKNGRELLLNEDLTVAEISYRVGFGSPTYFNRCFHAYFGLTPGELRTHEHENKPVEPSHEPIPAKHSTSKKLIGIILAFVIVIPTVFFMYQIKTDRKEKSIAILPFTNNSQDSTNVYFINGLVETITDKLSQIKDLEVNSRTSTERYRNNTSKSILQIARDLQVHYIMEGSAQMIGDSVLVSVQLIEARKDKHILSQQYTGSSRNILNLYSEIALDVASNTKALITTEEKVLLKKMPTENLNAYNFYLRGREQFDNYDDSLSLENSQRLFQKALALDSTFALAYSGLAAVYMYRNYWKTFLTEKFMDSVLILTNLALEYDNQCAEAYYFRGRRYYQLGMLPECLKEFDKALKINPDYWKIYNHLSFIMEGGANDFVGAIHNMNEAILRSSVEQLPALLIDLGTTYINIGFPEKGKQCWHEALELYGDSAVYLYWAIKAEGVQGNFEKAYQTAKRAYKWDSIRVKDLMPSVCLRTGRYKEAYPFVEYAIERMTRSGEVNPGVSRTIGYYYWNTGRTMEAEYYFDQELKFNLETIRLGRFNTIQRMAHFELAKVYAFLGEREKAYLYLDEVNKNQSFPLWWVSDFKYDPMLNSIRQEPRFQKIQKDVEAKFQAEHKRVRKWLLSQGLL
jgi:TolB-like protein/AraC-like DNA-binding protein/Tfp pilus assembly protein PilF